MTLPIKTKEKKELLKELEELYGITELPYQLFRGGKQRVRAFSGTMSKEEILELSGIARVEVIGMYLISQKDAEPRINFDAIPILKNQITKNIFEINEEQYQKWIRGYDLELQAPRGTLIIKFKDDLVGIGKSNGERIFNYLPKERKIKTQLSKVI